MSSLLEQVASSALNSASESDAISSTSSESRPLQRIEQRPASPDADPSAKRQLVLVGAHRRNAYVFKVLDAYVVEAVRHRATYAAVAQRFELRAESHRCAIYTQLNSIEDLTNARALRIRMSLDAGEAASLGYLPLQRAIELYDPAREFVYCVGVIGDEDQRGWFACAIVSRSGAVEADVYAFATPRRVLDFDPLYEESYRNAYLDAKKALEKEDDSLASAAQAEQHRRITERITEQDRARYNEQCAIEADAVQAFLDATPTTREQLHFVSGTRFEVDRVRAADVDYADVKFDKLRLDAYLQTFACQGVLTNCSRPECPVVEAKVGQFARDTCNNCSAASYCHDKCAKDDLRAHRKSGECALLRQLHRYGTAAPSSSASKDEIYVKM